MEQVLTARTPRNARDDRMARLVRRARSGDEDAFGELVEISWCDLVALARGLLASDAEAEDVVQEALVHAWGRLWTLRRPASFAAWIRRAVARRCWTRLRRRRPTAPFDELPQAPAEPGADLDVRRLLAALPPRQRAAVHLTWILGYTDREAGSILGIRAATVRVHSSRGLRRLRGMVEDR